MAVVSKSLRLEAVLLFSLLLSLLAFLWPRMGLERKALHADTKRTYGDAEVALREMSLRLETLGGEGRASEREGAGLSLGNAGRELEGKESEQDRAQLIEEFENRIEEVFFALTEDDIVHFETHFGVWPTGEEDVLEWVSTRFACELTEKMLDDLEQHLRLDNQELNAAVWGYIDSLDEARADIYNSGRYSKLLYTDPRLSMEWDVERGGVLIKKGGWCGPWHVTYAVREDDYPRAAAAKALAERLMQRRDRNAVEFLRGY